MSIDGDGFTSIQYQNANNSVRITDEFMKAVEEDGEWRLLARQSGEPVGEPVKARELIWLLKKDGWRLVRQRGVIGSSPIPPSPGW